MKLRKYSGKIKNRKDLEAIFQNKLPRGARVIFAHKTVRRIELEFGPPAQQEDVLAFWEFAHVFIGAHGMRRWVPDETTGELSCGLWMFPQESRIEPKSFLKSMTDEKFKWPQGWNTLKDAIREVASLMVEMEKEWAATPEENEIILASERFAPRRN